MIKHKIKKKIQHKSKEHRQRALWAAKQAEKVLTYFEEKYPDDKRPRKAIESARAWAKGKIGIQDARKAAWRAHAAARKAKVKNPAACHAARAAAQAAATCHVYTHADAVPYYIEKCRKSNRDLNAV